MQVAERLRSRPALRGEPWTVLVPLALFQWVALALFALRAQHAGWYFHNDPRATWTWTGGWLLGHGHLSAADAGWGWSYVFMPLSWILGADYVEALKVLIVLQGLVLVPLGLTLVYALGARLGGRVVGYLAAVLWAVGPYLAVAQVEPGYHRVFESGLLVQLLGLTGSTALPSAIALLASALFCLRAIDSGSPRDALAAGLAAGFAIGIEPLNALFLFAPLIGFAIAHRLRSGFSFALALVPALVVLAVWRARNPDGLDLGGIGHALALSGGHLSHNFTWIREDFWSLRLFQWIAAAGFVALARVAPGKAGFVGAWFFAFVLFRGSDGTVDVRAGSFWGAILPGAAGFCLLCAAIPLLVPRWGPRVAERFRVATRPLVGRRALGVAAVLTALVPLGLVAASASPSSAAAVASDDGTYVPIDRDLGLTARRVGVGVQLQWRPAGHGNAVLYAVYRSRPGHDRVCDRAGRCLLRMDRDASTYSVQISDTPGPGRWTFRVGWAAEEVFAGGAGILVELSKPLTITVR